MHGGIGKIPVDESHPVAQLLEHLLEHHMCEPAIRTLVIAVLDKGEGRVGRAAYVILRTNRGNEDGGHLRRASLACANWARNGCASLIPRMQSKTAARRSATVNPARPHRGASPLKGRLVNQLTNSPIHPPL